MTKALLVIILGTATLAVVVALVVVELTRPSDAELRRDVAIELGVPAEILELPLVDQILTDVGDRTRHTIADQLRTSLLVGGAAGGLTAISGAVLAACYLRRRVDG